MDIYDANYLLLDLVNMNEPAVESSEVIDIDKSDD